MSFGAIARTRVVLAKVKSGVPMAMTNWWKKTVEVEGEVRISWILCCCHCTSCLIYLRLRFSFLKI
jgi:hypothetical protein